MQARFYILVFMSLEKTLGDFMTNFLKTAVILLGATMASSMFAQTSDEAVLNPYTFFAQCPAIICAQDSSYQPQSAPTFFVELSAGEFSSSGTSSKITIRYRGDVGDGALYVRRQRETASRTGIELVAEPAVYWAIAHSSANKVDVVRDELLGEPGAKYIYTVAFMTPGGYVTAGFASTYVDQVGSIPRDQYHVDSATAIVAGNRLMVSLSGVFPERETMYGAIANGDYFQQFSLGMPAIESLQVYPPRANSNTWSGALINAALPPDGSYQVIAYFPFTRQNVTVRVIFAAPQKPQSLLPTS